MLRRCRRRGPRQSSVSSPASSAWASGGMFGGERLAERPPGSARDGTSVRDYRVLRSDLFRMPRFSKKVCRVRSTVYSGLRSIE